MKTLTIYGASDDLIETDGIPGCDEFGAYKSGGNPFVGRLEIRAATGALNVSCIYDGGWGFAITTPTGDCDEYPDWPIRRTLGGSDRGYSELIEIDCPDDAVLAFQPYSKWRD